MSDEPIAPNGEPSDLQRSGSELRYCTTCSTHVESAARGVCPKCRQFLPANTVRKKDPTDIKRREQLHAENIAEYQPSTLQLRRACRWLANISEKLEKVKEGSSEHQRLLSMWTELTQILEASRESRTAITSNEQLSVEQMQEQVNRVQRLIDLVRFAPPHRSLPPTASAEPIRSGDEATPPEPTSDTSTSHSA